MYYYIELTRSKPLEENNPEYQRGVPLGNIAKTLGVLSIMGGTTELVVAAVQHVESYGGNAWPGIIAIGVGAVANAVQ